MPKKLDEVRTQRIIEKYNECHNGYEVARVVGVALPTVYGVLRNAGIARTGKTGRARASDDAIISLYRQRKSGIATAGELGVCDRTVYDVLAKHGIETKSGPPRKFDAEQERQIATLYSGGLSASKIATRHKCSLQPVLDILTRLGVERNRRSPYDLDESEKAKIKSMWEDGSNFQEISAATGRTAGTVSRLLRQHHKIRNRPVRKGEGSPCWEGGRWIDQHGYVYVRVDGKGIYEHRLVMAEKLGRSLLASETVHHINGDRTDNRPENLQLRQGRHGKGHAMVCLDCGSHNIGAAHLN